MMFMKGDIAVVKVGAMKGQRGKVVDVDDLSDQGIDVLLQFDNGEKHWFDAKYLEAVNEK